MSEQQSGVRTVWTIGHSALPLDAFLAALHLQRIERVLDVRTIPRSLRNPQYNLENLPRWLEAEQIAYTHLGGGLGGVRLTLPASPGEGRRHASLRGHADHLGSPRFEDELQRLIRLASTQRCVLMCAEALPWCCHRALIADALVVRGWTVLHILGEQEPEAHRLTAFARVDGTRLTYP